jgi:acid phosphatase
MKYSSLALTLGLAGQAFAQAPTFSTIQPSNSEIAAAAATASTASYAHDNYVSGKAFDRFYIIWLENTDYDKAAGEPHLQSLAKEGITLTNYWALTHPSEPNYMASAGGEYFGLNSDNFVRLPSEVSTVADLLDGKHISWAEYQEDMPYTGYQGFQYLNQQTEANDYVRKHNPLVVYDSVADSAARLANIKNFTEFYVDLNTKALPQWAFITPNMTNDGHDTNVQVAGTWSYNFLSQLLQNPYFVENTLVVLTFDENETYTDKNIVYTLLLGDIPQHLKGTTDNTFYDHYSLLASVQANWGLPSLGRNDCGANVFELIAQNSGHKNKEVDTKYLYNNESAPGWLVNASIPIPSPTPCGNDCKPGHYKPFPGFGWFGPRDHHR